MGSLRGALVLVIGILAFGVVGWWYATAESVSQESAERPPFMLPVTTVAIERGSVHPRITLTGSVRSRSRAELAFDTAGLLAQVAVDEADTVRTGDVLARLDSRDGELAVAAANADLELAVSQVASLRAGARVEEQRRLEAVATAARAEQHLAELRVERSRKLVAERVLSQEELDTRISELEALTARRVATDEALAASRVGARDEDIAVQEARVTVERANVELARRELEKLVLRAPFDGAVVRRHVALGDHVSPGKVAFEVVDLARVEVVVEVPDRVALLLGERPTVTLSLDGRGGAPVTAVLDARIPLADEKSRNFRGLVRLEGAAAAGFEPGMFARVELALAEVTGALVVPPDALRRDTTGDVVVALAPGEAGPPTARFVPVRVLGTDGVGTAIEPLAGDLREGELVVVTGLDLAFPGAPLLPPGAGRPGGPGDDGVPGDQASEHEAAPEPDPSTAQR